MNTIKITTNDGTTEITIPAGFTKGSGKRILTALNEHGWTITAAIDWNYFHELVAAHPVDGADVTLTVNVAFNGAFNSARFSDRYTGIDTVTDVLNAIGKPTREAVRMAQVAERDAVERQREVAAEAAKLVYFGSGAADAFNWQRRHFNEAAQITPDAIKIPTNDWSPARRIVIDAQNVAVALIKKQLAAAILDIEGRVKSWNDNNEVTAVYTLPDAIDFVLLAAISNSDYYDESVAHLSMKAMRDIRFM